MVHAVGDEFIIGIRHIEIVHSKDHHILTGSHSHCFLYIPESTERIRCVNMVIHLNGTLLDTRLMLCQQFLLIRKLIEKTHITEVLLFILQVCFCVTVLPW